MSFPDDGIIITTLLGSLPDAVAIYRFGSTVSGQVVAESDVDLAVLPAAPLEPLSRWEIQERLSATLNTPVDLVDLLRASSVMRMQVLASGSLLYESDPASRMRFETWTYSSYARLNEERREILAQVRKEGSVYGG